MVAVKFDVDAVLRRYVGGELAATIANGVDKGD